MIRGLYIATSGMTANERLQEMNSNNIANANTIGYKSDDGVVRSFPELLAYRLKDDKGGVGKGDNVAIGQLGYGAALEEMVPRFVQGLLKESDNPYARAIIDTPPGADEPNRRSYFPVLVGNETMYTRDGDFKVQAGTNYLVTSKGDAVLPINAANGEVMQNLRIRAQADGTFQYINAATGQPFVPPAPPAPAQQPSMGIVDIVDSNALSKYGETYFMGGQAEQATGQMVERQLEQSNVDLAASMVSMMNVMRSYEANQRMIRTLDGTLEKAVSIGRL